MEDVSAKIDIGQFGGQTGLGTEHMNFTVTGQTS